MKNIFDPTVSNDLIKRINSLSPECIPLWGTMDVAQMLAHCCVSFEFIHENFHKRPNRFVRGLLRMFIKPGVVNDKPYPKNSRTAPVFVKDSKYNFEEEKSRLTRYIQKTNDLGSEHFEGLEYHSFGKMTAEEFSNCLYKHLDHHLQQFGV